MRRLAFGLTLLALIACHSEREPVLREALWRAPQAILVSRLGSRDWPLTDITYSEVSRNGVSYCSRPTRRTKYADSEPLPGSDDLLFGGPGNDTVTATAGDDFLSGGPGNDRMANRYFWDWDGWSDEESLDHGDDVYVGGAGDDLIDTFDGVSGNDTANAGEGTDRCAEDDGDTIWSCEEELVFGS
ncbi:MAG: hypothetical protein M3454_07515 [Actinomycetota bacterium]|nr:hypothetical protein [Actinomycetota bacterium]